VTHLLRAELPDEDLEGLEYAAFLAAADASVPLLADALAATGTGAPASPLRRVVISADVPPSAAKVVEGPSAHPAAITLTEPVSWRSVAAIHIDEPSADGDIRRAVTGETEAALSLEDRDLLWFAPAERSAIIATF
jgi:hypothetical protein